VGCSSRRRVLLSTHLESFVVDPSTIWKSDPVTKLSKSRETVSAAHIGFPSGSSNAKKERKEGDERTSALDSDRLL